MIKSKNKNLAKLKKLCEKRDSIAEENKQCFTDRHTFKEAVDNFLSENKESFKGSMEDIESLRDSLPAIAPGFFSAKFIEKHDLSIDIIMNYKQRQRKEASIAIINYIQSVDSEYTSTVNCSTIAWLVENLVRTELKDIENAYFDISNFLFDYALCYLNKGAVHALYAYCTIELKRFCNELKEQKNEKRKE